MEENTVSVISLVTVLLWLPIGDPFIKELAYDMIDGERKQSSTVLRKRSGSCI